MITDLSYIPNQELALVWGNGFTKINDISKVTNIGAYMVKYMTKNMFDERLQGRRCYTKSRNVKPPIPIRNIYAYAILNQIKGYKATYQNSYQSKYHRKIIYKQYILQEKVIRRLSADNPQVLPTSLESPKHTACGMLQSSYSEVQLTAPLLFSFILYITFVV